MNKPELESILKRARLPVIPEESLEMFPRRIVTSLKRNDPPIQAERNFSLRFVWAFGLAACIVIAFVIGHWSAPIKSGTITATDTLANLKLIQQTLAMFPNQVRAIVENEHGLNLILSDNDDVPASAPLYVRICDGKHCSSFVTFSGQEIQVVGQTVTVLADARGGIILMGNKFVWSNTGRTYAGNHLKIEAKNLGTTTM
jgi:hypothetical protein